MSVINPSTFTILTYRAFEPTEISGLKGWWKADSINQADNTSVSAWLDSSGNEAHMYQSSATAQPTLQTNELNGYPVVRFDGTNDFMNLTAPFDVVGTSYSSFNGTSVSNDGNYFVHANSGSSPKITIYKKNGNNFNKLSDPSILPAGTVYSSNFSNDGLYLAVPSTSSPFIQIYKRSGDTFTKLSNPASLPAGSGYYAHFSNDDSYLIVGHNISPFISIYSVNKLTDTFTKLSNPATLPNTYVWSAKFSTNSSFVALGLGPTSPYINFYSHSAGVLTKLNNPTTLPAIDTFCVSWLDDQTCAIASGATSIRIYQYVPASNTFELLTSFAHGIGSIYALEYSRNRNFLAVGGANSPWIKIYSVSGTTYTALSNPESLPIGSGRGIAWGANDTSILLSSSSGNFIQAYTFDGTTLTNLTKLNMFRNVGGGTVFLIIKYDVTALYSQSGFVASIGTNANTSRVLTGWQLASAKPYNGGRRLDTDTFQNVLATTTATTTFYMQTALIDYSNSDASIFINGKLENTNTSFQTSGLTSNTNSLGIYLGNNNIEWLKGDIAEVIVYNRALTTSEIRDVHYYLSAKYNITLAT